MRFRLEKLEWGEVLRNEEIEKSLILAVSWIAGIHRKAWKNPEWKRSGQRERKAVLAGFSPAHGGALCLPGRQGLHPQTCTRSRHVSCRKARTQQSPPHTPCTQRSLHFGSGHACVGRL